MGEANIRLLASMRLAANLIKLACEYTEFNRRSIMSLNSRQIIQNIAVGELHYRRFALHVHQTTQNK